MKSILFIALRSVLRWWKISQAFEAEGGAGLVPEGEAYTHHDDE